MEECAVTEFEGVIKQHSTIREKKKRRKKKKRKMTVKR